MITKDQIINNIKEIVYQTTDEITADEIYKILKGQVDPGRTQETIRKYIRDLVKEGRSLIGSSNKGYFHIDTPNKLKKAINNLEARSKSIKKRIESLNDSWENSNEKQVWENNNG